MVIGHDVFVTINVLFAGIAVADFEDLSTRD
jgi:hypothetical protein